MVFYDAHTKQGVQSFVTALNSLTLDERRKLAIFAMKNGLMLPKGWVAILFGLMKSLNRYDVFVHVLQKRNPEIIDGVFVDLIRHAQYGKDTEDKGAAAGGFSQREVNLISTNFLS